ncbi:MAG: hypothetical protein A2W93_10010 [Bacteroidetes bacterium GWF2_43_63]|nr:MAG: hypothetical protein A2W93_10010 [Bacteroidetes bacterium GWF2_43_63]HCB62331.1 hypothetical protein [Bacteroidales bacterium]
MQAPDMSNGHLSQPQVPQGPQGREEMPIIVSLVSQLLPASGINILGRCFKELQQNYIIIVQSICIVAKI